MKTTLINRVAGVILVLVCLAQSWQVSVSRPASGSHLSGFPLAYRDESALVRIPAAAGDIAGGIAGGVFGMAVGVPAGILLAPAQKEDIILVPVYGGYFFGTAGRLAGGKAAGAPFLLLQKIIREISRAFASREYGYRSIFS